MKIVLPGGSGQVGHVLTRALRRDGHDCVVLTRRPANRTDGVREVAWDGQARGDWAKEIDGADAVINLAGRSVDCRYTERNLTEMTSSRVDSTRVVGEAIATAKNPPRVWLQASSATIYAHRFDAANDEATGVLGGNESGVPALWKRSIDLIHDWEGALAAAPTPRTRKVALRTSLVMSPDKGGVFSVLARLCRLGAGRHGNGRQFVSWIHEYDFVAAVRFLIGRDDVAGAVNVCAPNPLSNRDFITALHRALGTKLAVPLPAWLLEIGAVFIRTETELILKSRRVVSGRLLDAGFKFLHPPTWPEAAAELVARLKAGK